MLGHRERTHSERQTPSPKHTQAARKHTPPTGVTIPSRRPPSAIRYRLPENNRIPTTNSAPEVLNSRLSGQRSSSNATPISAAVCHN
ncbi:hypothetical protein CF98_24850 [Halopseudomonas bauzanensis]|nr:hypothetical protein CF98_24850 [Halopseudomonas bauzanensis]